MSKLTLPILFIAAAGIRLAMVFSMPLYPTQSRLPAFNDEPFHLQYVTHLVEKGAWPIYEPNEEALYNETCEYIQPPLYYAIAAYAFSFAESIRFGWGLYGARLTSLMFGLVASLFIYRTLLLWRDDKRLAAGAAAAFLLAPNAVVFTSVITNDAGLICFSSVAFYSLLLCRSQGVNAVWRQIITGIFLAATVWMKMSGLVLLPMAWFAASPGLSKVDRWTVRLRVFILAVGFTGPLLVWNLANYGQIVPLAAGYGPEAVMGVSKGALFHPLQATMLFFRYAPLPYHDLWGSLHEKLISLSWVLVMGGLSLFGAYRLIRKRHDALLWTAPVGLVVLALMFYNFEQFQVEFRLMIPAFPALALLASVGARAVGLSPLTQALLWAAPLALIIGGG